MLKLYPLLKRYPLLKPYPLAVLAGLMTAASVQADETFRQHEAHVHGVVEMNIAQDAHELLIEITAPGADVVGFEHAPQSAAEHQTLDQAIERLEQADQLITVNPDAECHVEKTHVHQTKHHHDEEEEGHEHHDHDADHHDDHDTAAHEEHDEHEHEHEHGSHNAFTIEYHFECEHADALKQLSTQWFTHFPNTHSIHVNIFTDRRQSSAQLAPSSTQVAL